MKNTLSIAYLMVLCASFNNAYAADPVFHLKHGYKETITYHKIDGWNGYKAYTETGYRLHGDEYTGSDFSKNLYPTDGEARSFHTATAYVDTGDTDSCMYSLHHEFNKSDPDNFDQLIVCFDPVDWSKGDIARRDDNTWYTDITYDSDEGYLWGLNRHEELVKFSPNAFKSTSSRVKLTSDSKILYVTYGGNNKFYYANEEGEVLMYDMALGEGGKVKFNLVVGDVGGLDYNQDNNKLYLLYFMGSPTPRIYELSVNWENGNLEATKHYTLPALPDNHYVKDFAVYHSAPGDE